MAELSGKTALVTGAARRLGRAIALSLAGQGVNVAVHYRGSADEAESAAGEVRARGVRAFTVQADLADEAQAEGLFARAAALAGPIDILVNNASQFTSDRITDLKPADLWRNLQVHALAPLLLSRAFAAQGRGGCIVNLLDTRVVDYDAAHASYHISKRALHTITRMLARELAPAVRVNAVAPGLILRAAGQSEEAFRKLTDSVPLRRNGSADDVAEAVVFLLKAEFVTGQIVYVDGGRHMRGNMYG